MVSTRCALCTKGANGRTIRNESSEIGTYTVYIMLISTLRVKDNVRLRIPITTEPPSGIV